LRSEYAERSFAHTCETGAARRSWLWGLTNVAKRYWITAGAHNLGVVMRALYHVGTPRPLQRGLAAVLFALWALWIRLTHAWRRSTGLRGSATPVPLLGSRAAE
jgi:hypothetical protein